MLTAEGVAGAETALGQSTSSLLSCSSEKYKFSLRMWYDVYFGEIMVAFVHFSHKNK